MVFNFENKSPPLLDTPIIELLSPTLHLYSIDFTAQHIIWQCVNLRKFEESVLFCLT
jgi:hypothetical protein